MNSHTSPFDHMTLFVTKSSPKRTWVPRRVIGRLTVCRLVNINPGRPRTLSTAAPTKPQHHHLQSPKSESKSVFSSSACMASSSEPSRKRGRDEIPSPPPAEPEDVPPPPPTDLEEVPPSPPTNPEEVSPPPARRGEAAPARGGEAAPARGGEAAPAQGGAVARGGHACSCTKC
jgi:hypothetical protein